MTCDELTEIRRYLHQHPELSTQEKKTQKFLKEKLESFGIDSIKEVGSTGLMVLFKGEREGKKILLRTDIDALPIQETNDFEYRSETDNVSHKCGHDGHATIMLGVAEKLAKNPPQKGKVCLVFQPAEENGKGAKAILEDPGFDFEADKAFALHNLPGYKKHAIVSCQGSFTAAAKSVILKLKGKTSHAAEPEKGHNPGLAISEILQLSESLSEKDITKDDFRLITMVYVTMGEKAYGVSAGYGEVHLTLRSWRNDVMEKLQEQILKKSKEIAKKYHLDIEDEWLEIFHANDNDREAFDIIKKSADANDLAFEERQQPFKWGEDFGLYTEKFKGAMFGVGAGEETPALHNPDYDFPDEIIETGIKMFTTILNNAL